MRFATAGLLYLFSVPCQSRLLRRTSNQPNLSIPFRPSLLVYAFGAGVVAVSNAGRGKEGERESEGEVGKEGEREGAKREGAVKAFSDGSISISEIRRQWWRSSKGGRRGRQEGEATPKMQRGCRGREGEVCLQFLLVAAAAEKGSQVRRKKEEGAEKKRKKNRERDVGGRDTKGRPEEEEEGRQI